jgi:hypothetical protein
LRRTHKGSNRDRAPATRHHCGRERLPNQGVIDHENADQG